MNTIKQLEEDNEGLEAYVTKLQYDLFNLTNKYKRLEEENERSTRELASLEERQGELVRRYNKLQAENVDFVERRKKLD